MGEDELVGAGWGWGIGDIHGSDVALGVCRTSSASTWLDSQRGN